MVIGIYLLGSKLYKLYKTMANCVGGRLITNLRVRLLNARWSWVWIMVLLGRGYCGYRLYLALLLHFGMVCCGKAVLGVTSAYASGIECVANRIVNYGRASTNFAQFFGRLGKLSAVICAEGVLLLICQRQLGFQDELLFMFCILVESLRTCALYALNDLCFIAIRKMEEWMENEVEWLDSLLASFI